VVEQNRQRYDRKEQTVMAKKSRAEQAVMAEQTVIAEQ
jgi:hypothetical protein